MLHVSSKPLIGGHVSAAGGLWHSLENGERIGAEAIQIFGSSPRGWYARIPSAEEARKFQEIRAKSKIKRVFLHGAYLVNLASPEPAAIAKSVKNLSEHLKIATLIGADGLIFHVGSGHEAPKEEAISKASKAMKEVLKNVKGSTKLIIENAAGGGVKLGASAADIGAIMNAVGSPRVGVCIDTAHAFEAGLIEKYEPARISALLKDFDKEVGLSNVLALHINDSKTEFNSKHDRHENIGEGYIGLAGFKNLAKEKRLYDKAWLLEVPGFDNAGPDNKNIDILRSCFK